MDVYCLARCIVCGKISAGETDSRKFQFRLEKMRDGRPVLEAFYDMLRSL